MNNKNKIATMNVGDSSKLSKDTKYIKFEGNNDDFFWRVAGDVLNPDAEIIVPETHQAIYVKDGILQEVLNAGRYRIFDVKKGLFGSKKVGVVSVDIVFLSKTCKVKVLWGTMNPIKLRDPLTEIPVELRANGEFTIQVKNPKKFYLEIVGADKSFNIDSLKKRLAARMLSFVEPVIARVMHDEQLSYVDIAMNKKIIGDKVQVEVAKMFDEEAGLDCSSFTIYSMEIGDEEVYAIETELANRRDELKNKKDAKEIADEIERLEDKEWERTLLLRNLETVDRDKYYEVLKILGWKDGKAGVKSGHFCPKCGHSYEEGMKFCPGCGERLPGGKITCPKCHKELDSGTAFCPYCGEKLN